MASSIVFFLFTSRPFCRGPLTTEPSFDQRMSVVALLHMWQMDELFDTAVAQVIQKPGDPIRMLCASQTYDIKSWEDPAVHALVRRSTPLTEEEATRVGMSAAVKIFHGREKSQKLASSLYSHNPLGAISGSGWGHINGEGSLESKRRKLRAAVGRTNGGWGT